MHHHCSFQVCASTGQFGEQQRQTRCGTTCLPMLQQVSLVSNRGRHNVAPLVCQCYSRSVWWATEADTMWHHLSANATAGQFGEEQRQTRCGTTCLPMLQQVSLVSKRGRHVVAPLVCQCYSRSVWWATEADKMWHHLSANATAGQVGEQQRQTQCGTTCLPTLQQVSLVSNRGRHDVAPLVCQRYSRSVWWATEADTTWHHLSANATAGQFGEQQRQTRCGTINVSHWCGTTCLPMLQQVSLVSNSQTQWDTTCLPIGLLPHCIEVLSVTVRSEYVCFGRVCFRAKYFSNTQIIHINI